MSNDLEEMIRVTLRQRATRVFPPGDQPDPRHPAARGRKGQRLVVVATALALAVAGFALVFTTFRPVDAPLPPSNRPSRAAKVVGAELSAIIPTDTGASVSVGASGVWIAVPETDATTACSGAVERIDPSTNALADVFSVPGVPTAIHVTGELVWVATSPCADNELPSLLALTPNDGQVVASVELPVPNGTVFRLAESEGKIWVPVSNANRDRGAVIGVDEASHEIVEQLPVDGRLRDIAVTPSGIWLIDDTFEKTALIQMNPATGSATRLFDGSVDVRSGFALAGTPSGVWISLGPEGASLIDQNGDVARSFQVPGGFGPFAADDAGVWYWGLHMSTNKQVIGWLDAETGETRTEVELPAAPAAAALEGRVVWVALSGGGVARVDFETSQRVSRKAQ